MNTLPVHAQDASYPAGRHANEPAQYGVYDKPADRRLAPWITIGSIMLGLYGALLIIFTFIKQGDVDSLWALLISGIILSGVAILGLMAGITRRSQLAGLFFWAFLGGFIASAILLIINAARLDIYMEEQCREGNYVRESSGCQDVREYHAITYTALGAFFATWVPTFLIASAYFWRITRLYRKEPYEGARHDAYGNRYPVGQPSL